MLSYGTKNIVRSKFASAVRAIFEHMQWMDLIEPAKQSHIRSLTYAERSSLPAQVDDCLACAREVIIRNRLDDT
jgi:hypothetical protein